MFILGMNWIYMFYRIPDLLDHWSGFRIQNQILDLMIERSDQIY